MTFTIHFSDNVPNSNASPAPSIENQGATTEHPCRNHNITTCFHLIALQMNKVQKFVVFSGSDTQIASPESKRDNNH